LYSELDGITPIDGPTQGGTLIYVSGSRFDDQAYCNIGGSVVKPIIVSTTMMLCETPTHTAADNVMFELEFNDDVYQTNTGLSFSYYFDV
jgi:hypothetical protein